MELPLSEEHQAIGTLVNEINMLRGQVAALTEAVRQLVAGEQFDVDKLFAVVGPIETVRVSVVRVSPVSAGDGAEATAKALGYP